MLPTTIKEYLFPNILKKTDKIIHSNYPII